jgi:hypothetical protein
MQNSKWCISKHVYCTTRTHIFPSADFALGARNSGISSDDVTCCQPNLAWPHAAGSFLPGIYLVRGLFFTGTEHKNVNGYKEGSFPLADSLLIIYRKIHL